MWGDFIVYAKKIIIKGVLHFFCVFPIEKNKITLLNELSYTYGDSLKYIDHYIHSQRRGMYKIVFPIKKGVETSEYPDDVVVVPHTFRYFKELITSRVIITNAGGVSYLPKRKGQTIISTWHGGGPYKKTSTDVYNSFWYRMQVKMNADNTDYMLSSCRYFTDFEAKSMGYKTHEIIQAGLPRNDVLFNHHEEIAKKVRRYYSIADNMKFILFAPTFRGKFTNANTVQGYIELDIMGLLFTLEEKFGGKWSCGVRLHPKLADVDMSGLNVVNCTTYPDMQELLCCADVVISDYSSLIWDYSFTYRPIFLYAPDIEEYERKRGFYMPPAEWPFSIAHNNEELFEDILNFDQEKYIAAVKEHHVLSGSYETGTACQKIMKLIEK